MRAVPAFVPLQSSAFVTGSDSPLPVAVILLLSTRSFETR